MQRPWAAGWTADGFSRVVFITNRATHRDRTWQRHTSAVDCPHQAGLHCMRMQAVWGHDRQHWPGGTSWKQVRLSYWWRCGNRGGRHG